MAERDVVWAAYTRPEHPLSDSVFSKRVDIPTSIGSAASVLLQSLVTRRGRSVQPDLLQAVMISLIVATWG